MEKRIGKMEKTERKRGKRKKKGGGGGGRERNRKKEIGRKEKRKRKREKRKGGSCHGPRSELRIPLWISKSPRVRVRLGLVGGKTRDKSCIK
jgi:hypothetical protein